MNRSFMCNEPFLSLFVVENLYLEQVLDEKKI